jgi:hypothetical protein
MQQLEDDLLIQEAQRFTKLAKSAIDALNADDAYQFARKAAALWQQVNTVRLAVNALDALDAAKVEATQADAREIVIEATSRGYRTRFPFKPSDSAIRGFHQAGMAWQGSQRDVYWTIPAGKLELAQDIIRYWWEEDRGDKQNRHNCAPYVVRVAVEERKAA